jgi:hypothetical protein
MATTGYVFMNPLLRPVETRGTGNEAERVLVDSGEFIVVVVGEELSQEVLPHATRNQSAAPFTEKAMHAADILDSPFKAAGIDGLVYSPLQVNTTTQSGEQVVLYQGTTVASRYERQASRGRPI